MSTTRYIEAAGSSGPGGGGLQATGGGLSAEAAILEALVEGSQDQLVYLDRDFDFVRVNRAYAAGCRRAPEELLGRNHFELFPHAENQAIFERVRDTGEPATWREKPFVFPDQPDRGVTYWNWTLNPVKDRTGYVVGLVLSLHEVTDAVVARRQIRQSEDRFRLALRNAPVSVAVQDRELRFLWAHNQPTVPTSEVLGKTDADLFAPEDAALLMRLKRQVLESGVDVHEQLWLTAGGKRVFLDLWLEPLRDEAGAIAAVGIATVDLTRTRLVEDALRRSEARFKLLSDTARQLLSTDNPQGIIDDLCRDVMEHLDCQVFFNFLLTGTPNVMRLNACAGVPDAEVERIQWLNVGSTICGCVAEQRHRITAEDIQRTDDPRADLMRGYGVQAYCCHPLMGNGRVLGTLSFGSRTRPRFSDEDVALMKTVADQVATALQRMQAQEALRAANAQLVESDRRKTEFLGVLSHELRNPLAPIRNGLHLLEHTEPGGKKAQWAMSVIDRQVRQLSHLVDDLLDVTRITRGKIHLRRARVELNDIARDTFEDHRAEFEGAGVELGLSLWPEPLPLDADPVRLTQVIGNMLHNAAKFTARGGRASVSVERCGGEAIIRVRDTGAGLTQDMQGRLFEPFSQADRTLDRSRGGLGLGLALVKGIVDLHGGSVSAASAGVGKGTEFVVRLPLCHSDAAASPAHDGDERPVDSRRRVLIIEDNIDAADSLQAILELDGHIVEVARDGAEGIARARLFQPDIVLCDIGLPGTDGYAVARTIRRDAPEPAPRLVALTGYALPEDVARATEAGFDAHLAKPLQVSDLERILQESAAYPRPREVDGREDRADHALA